MYQFELSKFIFPDLESFTQPYRKELLSITDKHYVRKKIEPLVIQYLSKNHLLANNNLSDLVLEISDQLYFEVILHWEQKVNEILQIVDERSLHIVEITLESPHATSKTVLFQNLIEKKLTNDDFYLIKQNYMIGSKSIDEWYKIFIDEREKKKAMLPPTQPVPKPPQMEPQTTPRPRVTFQPQVIATMQKKPKVWAKPKRKKTRFDYDIDVTDMKIPYPFKSKIAKFKSQHPDVQYETFGSAGTMYWVLGEVNERATSQFIAVISLVSKFNESSTRARNLGSSYVET
jgi:hypothetical protein